VDNFVCCESGLGFPEVSEVVEVADSTARVQLSAVAMTVRKVVHQPCDPCSSLNFLGVRIGFCEQKVHVQHTFYADKHQPVQVGLVLPETLSRIALGSQDTGLTYCFLQQLCQGLISLLVIRTLQ